MSSMVDLSFKGFAIQPPSPLTRGCWELRVQLVDDVAIAHIPPRASALEVMRALYVLTLRVEKLHQDAAEPRHERDARHRVELEAMRRTIEQSLPPPRALGEAFPKEPVEIDIEAMRLQWYARLGAAEKRGAMPFKTDGDA